MIFAQNFGKEVPSPVFAIPDANLRTAIEDALGKASGAPITQAEMATLDSLAASGRGISDLTGLESATDLTWLYLASNNITNISVLAGLTNLTHLNLSDNSITDISPLSGLTNLTWLVLSDNNIRNISPLATAVLLATTVEIDLQRNPLNTASTDIHIPALQARGVHIISIESAILTVSDNTLTAGQSFTLETMVYNQATHPVSQQLWYFRSTDATIDLTDVLIHTDGGRVVTDLKPSATQTVSLDWTAPPYAGTYYYGVCLLTHCSTGARVTVEGSEGGSPDLIAHSSLVSHNPVTPPGSSITLEIKVENIGTGPAASTAWHYYRSDDETIDATDTELTYPYPVDATGRLAVLGTYPHGLTWPVPFEAGTYYYGICVDPTVGETNIDNNCSIGIPIIVEGSEGGSPDLIVVAPSTLDYRPKTGEFRMWAAVRNIGSSALRRKYLHITALRLIYLSSAFWRNYMAIREMGNNFRHDALAIFGPGLAGRSGYLTAHSPVPRFPQVPQARSCRQRSAGRPPYRRRSCHPHQ